MYMCMYIYIYIYIYTYIHIYEWCVRKVWYEQTGLHNIYYPVSKFIRSSVVKHGLTKIMSRSSQKSQATLEWVCKKTCGQSHATYDTLRLLYPGIYIYIYTHISSPHRKGRCEGLRGCLWNNVRRVPGRRPAAATQPAPILWYITFISHTTLYYMILYYIILYYIMRAPSHALVRMCVDMYRCTYICV